MNEQDTLGLSSAEAEARLRRDGPNVLADPQTKRFLSLLIELVTEPMIALLIAAVVLYLLLGEQREAIAMGASVFAIIALTLITEWRTERAARALRDLGSPRALVLRDGVRARIPGVDVVVGDLVFVEEGDRVPADGELLGTEEGGLLRLDESLLTGESEPVTKDASGPTSRSVFAGTLVASGRGRLRVTSTGKRTRMGAIGARLSEVEPQASPLRREIDRLVRFFAALGLLASIALAGWLMARGTPATESLLHGIGLAIGMIPEEYPVILTVFLALGAWRMSREHVLVRRLHAIEALGATTVLCVDKTGTLTENRMRLQGLWTPEGGLERAPFGTASAAGRHLLTVAAQASRRTTSEPMDRSIVDAAADAGASPDGTPIYEYPFGKIEPDPRHDDELARALSRTAGRAWQTGPGTSLALKGAVEAVTRLADEPPDLEAITASLAAEGLRVLCVAEAVQDADVPVPERRTAVLWKVLGLIGIADPVRPEVPAAVKACTGAGVRVLMITGDHPETARAIAARAGIERVDLATGADIESLSDTELIARVATLTVVARAHPEHKLRIVEALSARGDVVAMTGDGVNDALALKAAAIGIAMGGRGTDVAREAASIVLTDDRFDSIVSGLRRGRRIFENLQRASGFVLMVHVILAGLALIPVALGLPPAVMPLHIVLLELVVDPSCSIVFEREPAAVDLITRPPRDPKTSILERRAVLVAVLAGVAALTVSLLGYTYLLGVGVSAESARFVAFMGIVTALVVSIPASRRPGTGLDRDSTVAIAFLLVAIVAALIALFSFAPARAALHWELASPLALASVAGVVALAVGLVYRVASFLERPVASSPPRRT